MSPKSNGSHYAVCVTNRGYDVALVVRRIYKILEDPEAAKRNLLRVVDESGDDYLYPAAMFVTIDLPREAEQAFDKAG